METQQGEAPASEIIITPSDILFECPSCGKSMVIDESAADMIVECPQCHTNVIVPPRLPTVVDAEQGKQANQSLLLAAQQGDVDSLDEALAQGADVNATPADGTTALMLAVQQAKGELVNALIARGANLEAKRADGRTAVTLAERGGQFPILRALWKAGAKRPSRFFGLRRRRV